MNLHARTHNVTYRTTWNYSTRAGDNHKAMPSADKMMNKSLLVEKAIQNWFTFNAMPSQTNHRTQLNPFTLFLRLLVSHCPLRCRLISKLDACIVHIHILYTEHTEHIHILCKIISVFLHIRIHWTLWTVYIDALIIQMWCCFDCCWSEWNWSGATIPCDIKAFINVVNVVYVVHSCGVHYAFSKYHLTYERFQANDYMCRTL